MTTPSPPNICCYPSVLRSRCRRDSVVGMGTNKCAVLGRRSFSILHTAHPASYCSMYRRLSPKVKRLVNAVTLHPSSSEVKMSWTTPFPSRCLGSLDKEAFIVQWNFLWQTATSRWEGHRSLSGASSDQFLFYQTNSTPCRRGQSSSNVGKSSHIDAAVCPKNFTEFCRRDS
jgi:hypothetical protein